jgi:hypothetical protein
MLPPDLVAAMKRAFRAEFTANAAGGRRISANKRS